MEFFLNLLLRSEPKAEHYEKRDVWCKNIESKKQAGRRLLQIMRERNLKPIKQEDV